MKRSAKHVPAPFDDRTRSLKRALLAAALLPMTVAAQGTASGPGLRFGASIDAQSSYVVNSSLGGRDNGEFVAGVRPGFSVTSRSGRVVGALAYGLSLQQRSRNGDADDDVQHNLSAQVSAEAIERWMYIDAAATISQQLKDPYGVRSSSDSAAGNANRREVATATISPYVRGLLGRTLNYEVRLNAAATNARRSIDSDSSSWGGQLSISQQLGLIGWGLSATTQETDYRVSRSTRNDRVTLSANWLPDPDLTLRLRGGEESTDSLSVTGEPQRYTNWGAGVTWRPSPRTRAQIDGDRRYFGNAYSVLVEHRLSQASISINSSRSDSGTSVGSQPAVTALQFRELVLLATISDPGLRQQQALLDLQQAGVDPNEVVIPALLNSAVSVIDSNALTFGYSGRRLSFGAQAYMTKNRIIDSLVQLNAEPIEQQGWTLNLGYQFNPTTNFAFSLARQDTRATPTRSGTNLKSVTASAGTQIGRRATASLGARYSVFNSSTDPYREAAVTAALGYRF